MTHPSDILAILCRGGHLRPGEQPSMAPLSGGVSSDIWWVRCGAGAVCVKRALPRLKVAADWRAPIERNSYEAAYLRTVGAIEPAAVPRLLYRDRAANALVMSFLEPARFPIWKDRLRDGEVDLGFARRVGTTLGRIHRATARDNAVAERFDTGAIFQAIRLEPYLLATAQKHPDLERALARLARRTAATRLVLVHGDVSPKNILAGPDGPVLLDAECAWYGDPAFDLAFCLNHLLLKCLWVPGSVPDLLAAFDALAEAYFAQVAWEPRVRVEARAATLLPGLFLARVDGKSPVEYLSAVEDKEKVRRVARELLLEPVEQLALLRARWAEELAL